MRKFINVAALVAAAVLLAVGCTSTSDQRPAALKGDRSVKVTMTDNAYKPNKFAVTAGSTITFAFVNKGQMTHEAYIGTTKEQEAHEAEMSGATGSSMRMDGGTATSMDMAGGSSGMGHGSTAGAGSHTEAGMVTVAPGSTGNLTYTFDRPGTYLVGCHQPGHWASGMRATVTVS